MSRIIRYTLVALVGVGVAAGATYFLLLKDDPESRLNAAEAAYAQGVEALEGNPSLAYQRLDEARLQAEKVFEALQDVRPKDEEEVKKNDDIAGRAYWVKARAIRDLAYARAAEEGEPLSLTLDSTTGKMYRSFGMLTDSEALTEAIGNLALAAEYLPDDLEVQNQAFNVEFGKNPRNWTRIKKHCENILEITDNKDTRANYQLAYFHFYQPLTGARGPDPFQAPDKRRKSSVLDARKYLDQSKQDPDYQFWRTRYLEAQIAQWLRDYSDVPDQDRTLDNILFHDKSGLVAQVASDESIANEDTYDLRGVLGLHEMALDELLAKSGGALDRNAVEEVLTSLLKVGRAVAEQEPVSNTKLKEIVTVTAKGLFQAQVVLSENSPRWESHLEQGNDLVRQALDAKIGVAEVYATMVQTLAKETRLAAQEGRSDTMKRYQDLATGLLEDARDLADELKLPPRETAALDALAAQRELFAPSQGGEDLNSSIERLERTGHPVAVAQAEFLKGARAMQEGKMEPARAHLERSVSLAGGEASILPHMLLTDVYLRLGMPKRTLEQIQILSKFADQIAKLPEDSSRWMPEKLRGPDDLNRIGVVANLALAREELLDGKRKNPKAETADLAASLDEVKKYEAAARELIGKLPPRGDQYRIARQVFVLYYATTGRVDTARSEMALARQQFPASLDLLKIEAGLRASQEQKEKGGISKDTLNDIDTSVKKFLADNPKDRQAKLFWASWQLATRRNAEAVAYLRDPANFAADDDGEDYRKVLGLATLAGGDRDEGMKLLEGIESSVGLDQALITLAGSLDEREQAIQGALDRHENDGRLLLMNAVLKLQKGQFEEAGQEFVKAMEYTGMRSLATKGLLRTIIAWTNKSPVAAREFARARAQEFPEEQGLYLGYAYACLKLRDYGSPGESWSRKANMASALNQWERIDRAQGEVATRGPLVKADFWMRTDELNNARAETRRALAIDPEDEIALTFAIRLALASDEPTAWEEGWEYLARLTKVSKNSREPMALKAALELRTGKNAEATQTYEKLLTEHPDYVAAYAPLIQLLRNQKADAKVTEWLGRWGEAAPGSLNPVSTAINIHAAANETEKAVAAADRFLTARVDDAKAKIAEGKIENPDQHLAKFRDNIQVALAGALSGAGLLEQAEARLSDLSQDPDRLDALMIRGDIAVKRKDWDAARAAYEKVLDKQPRHFTAGNNLAWMLSEVYDKPEEALELVRRVRKGRYTDLPVPADELPVEFLDTIGAVFSKLNDKSKFTEMKDIFTSAVGRYSRDARMFYYLGKAQAELAEAEAAADSFRTGLVRANANTDNPLDPAQRDQIRQKLQAGLDAVKKGGGGS